MSGCEPHRPPTPKANFREVFGTSSVDGRGPSLANPFPVERKDRERPRKLDQVLRPLHRLRGSTKRLVDVANGDEPTVRQEYGSLPDDALPRSEAPGNRGGAALRDREQEIEHPLPGDER